MSFENKSYQKTIRSEFDKTLARLRDIFLGNHNKTSDSFPGSNPRRWITSLGDFLAYFWGKTDGDFPLSSKNSFVMAKNDYTIIITRKR